MEQASLFGALVEDEPVHLRADYGFMSGSAGHRFDEMVGPDGRPKPHWQVFLRSFNALGAATHQRLVTDLDRSLSESGIAFNVYADPDGGVPRGQMDPIPVVFEPDDWDRLAAGMAQRARLIDAVLLDLYGPRRLLQNRMLPPGAVFGNLDFLVHCADWAYPQERSLFMYACDIARMADGRWCVLADHIDVPTGNGTVLANRVALTQNLGNVFLDCGIRRLASHYARFQSLLDGLASEDGLMVVLSPGELGADYFSHAYLARYLGLAMAEPGDLTVRDDRLFLKTLEGLRRVDVVLRKLPSRGLDPLYMVGDGAGGVPGIIEASRGRAVTFANALGAGVMDFRALAPWSAELATVVLNEDLLLPDAPALWLGDPENHDRFLDEASRWRLAQLTSAAAMPAKVLDLDRSALRQWLEREGTSHVALQDIDLATTPRLDHDRLVATPYVMRTFLAAGEDGYTVLPGGIVRCLEPTGPQNFASGTIFKDVWVQARDLAGTDISLFSRQLKTAHLRRTGRELPSRAADNLFWLGRYAERAETTLRILRAVISRLLDATRHDRDPRLLSRLLSLHLQGNIVESSTVHVAYGWFHHAVALLATDANEPYGLRQSLDAMQRTANDARAYLSQDGWRVISALCADNRWREFSQLRLIVPFARMVDDALRSLSALSGSAAENMTRNYAWRFLELGRRIERGSEGARIISQLATVHGEGEAASLRALLDLGDSFATYRSRYLMTPAPAPVLDLLILDETNPRSIAYQLAAAEQIFESLGRAGPYRSAEHRLVLALLTTIRMIDADQFSRQDTLLELMDRCAADLRQVSNLVARRYFVLAEPTVATTAMARSETSKPEASS